MTSTTTPTVTNLDKVCRNIGRLPLEMRHAIFNCLTVDFRLEMVLQKKAHIIRKLYEAYDYRILDINALKRNIDLGIRWRFFVTVKNESGQFIMKNQTRPTQYLTNIEYKQMGEIVSTEHPAFKALRQIVVVPKIHGSIKSNSLKLADSRHARNALSKIVSTITKSCDILPTFAVPSHSRSGKKFNYYVKRYTFQFMCILSNFISKLEVQIENAAIKKTKQTFKQTVARYIPYAFRKMQRKIKLSAKIAKAAAIKAAKEAKAANKKAIKDAKEATKKATKEAKEAKAANKKAIKDAKEATKKATKEAKEAAKNKK